MTEPFKPVLTSKEGQVLVITINRPEIMNAINEEMIAAMTWVLDDARTDPEVRVIVLTGAGRGFCAGGQLKARDSNRPYLGIEQPDEVRRGIRQAQSLIRSLVRMEKPTIAMVNGPAMGAGLSLALACDLRIASDQAKFGSSFTRIGIIPGTGDTWFLPRLIGTGRAAEMLLTGDTIDAATAERFGLVNRVVPAEDLEAHTIGLAQRIAEGPPIVLRLDKMLMYRGLTMDLENAMDIVAECAPVAWMSEDKKEGMAAFQERRRPHFRGR
jgi:2-(1,2-epoxy-1,2-dihydrophenyl)acetyl-CoA isomerase